MLLERHIDDFAGTVTPPPSTFRITFSKDDKALEIIPVSLQHSTSANLDDPINHLIAMVVKFQFDATTRTFILDSTNMTRYANDVLADRIREGVKRLPISKYPTLSFWCQHYIFGYNITGDSSSNQAHAADTLLKIYCFAAARGKENLDQFVIPADKMEQFGALMMALKAQLSQKLDWTSETDPNKRRQRRRRRR